MVAWCKVDGTIERVKVTELFVTEELDRVSADEVGPGQIAAIAGLDRRDHRRDPGRSRRPAAAAGHHRRRAEPVDDDRRQHVADVGPGGHQAHGAADQGSPRRGTGRQRVAARVHTERPDMWEVQGRGELQLAILVEMLRREGFELTVGKPQVLTREVDGKLQEPVERVAIDVPEDYLGVVTQLVALRKGRMVQMVNHGTGWVRMEFIVPARGLIGFRTEFLTETRGTGQLHHVFEGFEPWFGELRTRPNGSLVSDRRGPTTTYRADKSAGARLDVRGSRGRGVRGHGDRAERAQRRHGRQRHREKKQTNVRSAAADETVRLVPATPMGLEQALEFIREDECIEVTPESVRIRKVTLDGNDRGRALKRAGRP